jgi:hypothetical protein
MNYLDTRAVEKQKKLKLPGWSNCIGKIPKAKLKKMQQNWKGFAQNAVTKKSLKVKTRGG